jgi:hypothetical protein
VPLAALERLGDDAGDLELELETREGRIEVRCKESLLAFRPAEQQATLEEVRLSADRGGAFFHRVVSELMARFAGDLHVKLTWSGPLRPQTAGLAEVRIERGATRYPSLKMKNVVSLLRSSAEPTFEPSPTAEAGAPSGAGEPSAPGDAAEDEIEKLLERGRQQFAEYQRLAGEKK